MQFRAQLSAYLLKGLLVDLANAFAAQAQHFSDDAQVSLDGVSKLRRGDNLGSHLGDNRAYVGRPQHGIGMQQV